MDRQYQYFKNECSSEIETQGRDSALQAATQSWTNKANCLKYSYHFEYLGRPIIQYPQDMVAMQELIWKIKPDLIIETGIAHGGSLVFSASMLAQLDLCDAIEAGTLIDPKNSKRKVAENVDARVFFWPLSGLPMFEPVVSNIRAWTIPNRAINLPSYHDMNEKDITRIINIVKTCVYG